MRTLKYVLAFWIAVVLTVALFAFMWQMAKVVRDMQDAVKDLTGHLNKTLDDTDAAMIAVQGIQRDTTRTEAEMAGLLNETRHSMLTATQEQQLVDHADEVLADADTSVKALGVAATQIGNAAPQLDYALAGVSADSHQIAVASEQAIGNLNADLIAPEIRESEANVERTTESAALAAANAEAASGDIRTWVHRETTPVRGTWNVVKAFLMEFAGPAAQVATAAK